MNSAESPSVQNHLCIDFPTKGPAHAAALRDELPSLMPDFATVQDRLGNVHYSRFMVKGDEKLLFLSDIDGEGAQHIERLVQSAGPMLDAIFKHAGDAPPTSVASDPQGAIQWLKQHVRQPLDTYFAYAHASVQDIQSAARAAGFTGKTPQSPLLTYMAFESRVQGFVLKLVGKALVGKEKGQQASDAIGTLHFSHWVPFDDNHIGFFTIYDGAWDQYMLDFATKTAFVWDALFPHIKGAPPPPVAKDVQAFSQFLASNNYPPIGFYSAYPGLSVLDIRALLADRKSQTAA